MSKSLPMCRCEWLDPAIFVLVKCEDDSLRGCLLEVDLEYPNELHELHNNYPLATDILKIKIEMLSNHQLKMLIIIIFLLVMLKKLVPNFFKTEKYVVHTIKNKKKHTVVRI